MPANQVNVFGPLQLDNYDRAQAKVAADTGVLLRQASVAYTPGAQTVSLPPDAVRVLGVSQAGQRVPTVSEEEAMRALSGGTMPVSTMTFIIGRSIGLLPSPALATTLDLIYEARPSDLTSTGSLATFQLEGDYALAVKRLAKSWELGDDGQPERAGAELAFYQTEMPRLRRRHRYREHRTRLYVHGYSPDRDG